MKNVFLPTVSSLAIGALVFRWTKASVTFVCKSCLTSAIMLHYNQPKNIKVKQLTVEHLQAKNPKVELTLHTNLPNDR